MKKFLLFIAVALVVSTAGAQMKTMALHSRGAIAKEKLSKQKVSIPVHQLDKSKIATTQEIQARDISDPNQSESMSAKKAKSPVKDVVPDPFYRRPAGMFCATFFNENGVGSYSYLISFLMAKPFAEYSWEENTLDANNSTNYAWDFWINSDKHSMDYQSQIKFSTPIWIDPVPILYAVNGRLDDENASWFDYQIRCSQQNYSTQTIDTVYPAQILSGDAQSLPVLLGDNLTPMYSSKTMVYGGRYSQYDYILTSYIGLQPYGNNENGWWFGKNGGRSNGMPINGIAQAFEKPQHPYKLNNVYLETRSLEVNNNVRMTCKVYKLNEIPDFQEEDCVSLPEEPGELIATGEAIVTPSTASEKNGLITFTLYGQEDGLSFETCPTIDFPILVCIDGYNDVGMEDLADFSAYISTDYLVDEGYGELAYLKCGNMDDDGHFTGEYTWYGLNNFFSIGTMKTGYSIYIGTENNFITFDNDYDDGEYLFPSTGGILKKTWADGSTTTGIKFLSSRPLWDDDWHLICDGIEEVPDWLTIELSDQSVEDESPYYVTADVMAQPLPSGVTYREATVRFALHGNDAYIDYKFMQGEKPVAMRGDVNGDGNVNIADVTTLINILLSNSVTVNETNDVNCDSRVNISDVTMLITYLLGNADLQPIKPESKTFTVNGVSFTMIAVEGGTFAMGGTRDQGDNVRMIEKPVHLVTLSDYCIGQTEVTQALWLAVMGSNPSNFKGDFNRPVEMVSWNQCQEFITQLNQITGMQFRMPTEAEWEFAARGGNKSLGNMYSGSNDINLVAWNPDNAESTTHPVATKKPNELGIYDMSGNVYEYCQDFSSNTPNYPEDPQINPTGPETGSGIIIRGGSIDYGPDYCRNAYRWADSKDSKWKDQGLRLAL